MDKTTRFNIPSLEKQLRQTRILNLEAASKMVATAKDYRKCMAECSDSTLTEAKVIKLIDDLAIFENLEVTPNNGLVIVEAFLIKGTLVRPHFHKFVESIRVLEGELLIQSDSVKVQLREDGRVKIPADVVHTIEAIEDTRFYISELRSHFLKHPSSLDV